MVGRSSSNERKNPEVDPVTGEKIEDLLLNAVVYGEDEEELDPWEVRIHFDELRTTISLEFAKKSIPNWREYTIEGDPYPIPRSSADPHRPAETVVKGSAGFLVDTNEEGALDKFIAKVRDRAGQNSDNQS